MLASVSCSGKRYRLVSFNCLIDGIKLSGGLDFVSAFLIICWMRFNTRVVTFRIALSGVSRSCDIAFVSLSWKLFYKVAIVSANMEVLIICAVTNCERSSL